MIRTLRLICILLFSFILVSCAAGRYPYPKTDLAQETWRSQVQTDPSLWTANADRWFRQGESTIASSANARESIRVSHFKGIRATGNFRIQISGSSDTDAVCIEGPSHKVRAIKVNVANDILCLEQAKDAPDNMNEVTVRISMRRLEYLMHHGLGRVEGVRLDSRNLVVEQFGCGDIFLAGHMNIRSITNHGPGSVNIFTICSNDTDITTDGNGDVNVFARGYISLHKINHKGSADINVIGARGGNLIVNAKGRGKIGISGHVNVREIRASGKTCVFIASSDSIAPCIYVYDDARVGIDGRAGSLNAYTVRTARLMAKNLFPQNAYVTASGQSHMNINALNKIFAEANDYATIYFFGNSCILTAFEHGYGTVIKMGPPCEDNEIIVAKNRKSVSRCYTYPVRKKIRYGSQFDSSREYTWRGKSVGYIK
ncbi:MAG TPA: DUF2807 domain-containing protein [Gammaproteobacteria bacterium]|jgi:hypothetical protein|nr:DUF2807 domain-containing protein [Gammaproteobacteria bacterium]